jgi:beta-N-acetylhexosaminidase
LRGRNQLVGTAALCATIALESCTFTPARPPASRAGDVDALLASLTLEEKVGQLFVVPGNARFLNERSKSFQELVHFVVDDKVGGLVWFKSEVWAAAILDARLQELAKVPLLVAADLEAGSGMRFDEATYGAWAMAVAATGDPSLAERRARATAEEARALGIAQVYAPVADVNVNPDNPVINVRSFGEDPEDAARYVAAVVKGLEAGGVLATLKHFPGHGDVTLDSHCAPPTLRAEPVALVEGRLGLARSGAGRARLDAVELPPFRAGIAAGASAVMTAHVAVPALDATPAPPLREGVKSGDCLQDRVDAGTTTTPATLSRPIVTGLLRGELGFSGLVVTDAMRMGGIVVHYEAGDAAVRALLAGNDQILLSEDTDKAIAAVIGAVRSGALPLARVDDAARHVLLAKRRAGLLERRLIRLGEVSRIVSAPEHEAIEEEIARRSLTLVREEAGALPIPKGALVLVVNDEPTLVNPAAPLLAELGARLGAPPRALVLDPRSTAAEVDAAVAAGREAGIVLAALCVRTRSGAGVRAVPAAAREALARLAEAKTRLVGVSFGNPYVLREVPELPTYVAAYGVQEVVQVAAARALLGASGFEGRLPVTIPGLAARGTGLRKGAAKP